MLCLLHQAWKKCLFPCKLGKISLQQGRFPSSVGWFPLCISLFFPSKSQNFQARSFPFCQFFPRLYFMLFIQPWRSWINVKQDLKDCGMGPWLILVSPCFRENVVAICKIGSFVCSLDNLLQKNVIVFFFGNQMAKWRSFEKKGYF